MTAAIPRLRDHRNSETPGLSVITGCLRKRYATLA